MSRLLQAFAFRESPYERVEQEWRCGRAATGDPCPLGPDRRGRCRGEFECVPNAMVGGEGYSCARDRGHGGPCAEGPSADGQCSHHSVPCSPVRSLRARRALVTRLAAIGTLGILVLLLYGSHQEAVVSPGALSAAHGDLAGKCDACHRAATRSPGDWLGLAFTTRSTTEGMRGCLDCHRFGNEPHLLRPHALPEAVLAALTEKARTHPVPAEVAPSSIADLLSGSRPPSANIACATCHAEHQGRETDLLEIANRACQVCHVQQFSAFNDGHPEFVEHPFHQRRNPIAFDHRTHFDKHFKEYFAKHEGTPPACADCHAPDPQSGAMAADFDRDCVQCHEEDVTFALDEFERALTLLTIPRIESEDSPVAAWPAEIGESRLKAAPEMRLLLGEDGYQAWNALPEKIGRDKKYLRQRGMTFKRLNEAVTPTAAIIADSIREALRGPAASEERAVAATTFKKRIESVLQRRLKQEQVLQLFPEDLWSLLKKAYASWFVAAQPLAEQEQPLAGPGFFVHGFSIGYMPEGHADPVLAAWVPLLADLRLQEGVDAVTGATALARKRPKDPLQSCTKCHNVDAEDGSIAIHWTGIRRSSELARFDHRPHLGFLPPDRTAWPTDACLSCHHLNPDLETRADFFAYSRGEVSNPAGISGNFGPISKETCAECHNPDRAGEACLICHVYHAGTRSLEHPQ
jgi:hypothetical protein